MLVGQQKEHQKVLTQQLPNIYIWVVVA